MRRVEMCKTFVANAPLQYNLRQNLNSAMSCPGTDADYAAMRLLRGVRDHRRPATSTALRNQLRASTISVQFVPEMHVLVFDFAGFLL
eukprot:1728229-Rhodomonas_salina.1